MVDLEKTAQEISFETLKTAGFTYKLERGKIIWRDSDNKIANIELACKLAKIEVPQVSEEDVEDQISQKFEERILNANPPFCFTGTQKSMTINVIADEETNEYRVYPYPMSNQREILKRYVQHDKRLLKFYEENRFGKKWSMIPNFIEGVLDITANKHYSSFAKDFKIKPFSFNKSIPSLHYIDVDKVIDASARTPELFLNAISIFENPEDYCAWWGFNMANLCNGQAMVVIGSGEEGKTTLSELISKLIVGEENYSTYVAKLTRDMLEGGFSESAIGKLFLIGDDTKDENILKSSFMHQMVCNKGKQQTFRIKNGSDYCGEVTASIVIHENDYLNFNIDNSNEDRRYIWVVCKSRDNEIGNTIESNAEIGNNPARYGRKLSAIEFEKQIKNEAYEIIAYCLKCAGLLDYIKTGNLSDIKNPIYNIVKNRQLQNRDFKEFIRAETSTSDVYEVDEFIEKNIIISDQIEDKIDVSVLLSRIDSYFGKSSTQRMKREIKNKIKKLIRKHGIVKNEDKIGRYHGSRLNSDPNAALHFDDKAPDSYRKTNESCGTIVSQAIKEYKDQTPLNKAAINIQGKYTSAIKDQIDDDDSFINRLRGENV